MFSIIETIATAILLIILMILIIHLIRGDAGEWLLSKFQIEGLAKVVDSIPKPAGSTTTSSSDTGQNA